MAAWISANNSLSDFPPDMLPRRQPTCRPSASVTETGVNDFRPYRSAVDGRPLPIWDELRAASRWCTPSASSAATCRRPMRQVREIANGHRAFLLAPHHRTATCGRRSPRMAPADHLRSARAQAGQAIALLPPFTPDAMKKPRSRGSRHLQRADRRLRLDGKVDARSALYGKLHLRLRAIAHMLGIPKERQRPLRQLDPHDPWSSASRTRPCCSGGARDERLFQRPISRRARRSRPTI
jgi:hypothetical protein